MSFRLPPALICFLGPGDAPMLKLKFLDTVSKTAVISLHLLNLTQEIYVHLELLQHNRFILISWKVVRKWGQEGFTLRWPCNSQPRSRSFKVVSTGRSQSCLQVRQVWQIWLKKMCVMSTVEVFPTQDDRIICLECWPAYVWCFTDQQASPACQISAIGLRNLWSNWCETFCFLASSWPWVQSSYQVWHKSVHECHNACQRMLLLWFVSLCFLFCFWYCTKEKLFPLTTSASL